MSPLIAYLVSFGATFLAAIAGSAASIQAGAFYGALAKPSWAPPAGVFGPVWMLLYVMMAAAGGMAMNAGSSNARGLIAPFVAQLALNALWSWTFFKWESGLGSMITIAALWVFILATVITFWKANSLSGILLLPYLAWVTFAAGLNASIWNLNRGAL
jgi:tryptophan-rich sensory protein